MPGKRAIALWYIILAAAVFASAGFMGLQIRERMQESGEEEGLSVVVKDRQTDVSAVPTPSQDDGLRRITTIYSGTKVFQPLVTPRPTPTKPPIPTATPTPLPLAQNYKIVAVMGNSAILMDYRLMQKIVREGQTVDDPLGSFTVVKIDGKAKRVLVRLLSVPQERWITEQFVPATGAPAPAPRRGR